MLNDDVDFLEFDHILFSSYQSTMLTSEEKKIKKSRNKMWTKYKWNPSIVNDCESQQNISFEINDNYMSIDSNNYTTLAHLMRQ